MAKPSSRAKQLLRWFATHARDLPWRVDPTPYRVWVSEIMLQQTRVEAVRDKYTAFLQRFPDVRKLASASEETVLAAWSGLGYYRRARMLHAAAQQVVARHAGKFPATTAELLQLPGIGRYTAGAIASIALNQPEPIVDGNIERVFARWGGIRTPIKSPATQRQLWTLAKKWVEDGTATGSSPRDLNQSLMELGALVCTPTSPRCRVCPVAATCKAAQTGKPENFPNIAKRAIKRDVRLWFAALTDRRGRVFLVRRQDNSRQSLLPDGLWELPHETWPMDEPAPLAAVGKLLHCKLNLAAEVVTRKHSIMDWRVTLVVQAMTADSTVRWLHGESGWFTYKAAAQLAQASATSKLLTALIASRH